MAEQATDRATVAPRPLPGPDERIDVAEAVARIESAAADDDVLDALTLGAYALVTQDLVHRLVPAAPRLRDLDYRHHPWAALPAGVAICAVDRGAGRQVLAEARRTFESAGCSLGTGWAHFLEGLEDLGEGHLASATQWWASAEAVLADISEGAEVIAFTAINRCLTAYAAGDIATATFTAERALNDARRRSDARGEVIAAAYLALFRWWTGSFTAMERAASFGMAALERVHDPQDRYDEPLLHGALGAVAYVRGDFAAGDDHLQRGLEKAQALQNEWHEAILRTIRAELTSEIDARRGLDDVRSALAYFDRIGEEWWRHWALEAAVVAQRANGDLVASLAAADDLLRVVDNPLERARAHLEKATTLVAAGQIAEARDEALVAVPPLEKAGARYLTARAQLVLARCGVRGEYFVRAARACAGDDRVDPAWRRLLRGAPVRIRLLGAATVEVDGQAVALPTRHALEALALLALAGDAGVQSDRLAEALWPGVDPHRARHRLDVTLSSIRRAMFPASRLSRRGNVVSLELVDGECDARDAMAVCRRAVRSRVRDAETAAAIALLRQPFLGGSYSEWALDRQADIDRLLASLEDT